LKYRRSQRRRYSPVFIREGGSFICLVLGDHVLRLDRRWSIQLSSSEGCSGGKNVLFKKALVDKFFQVPLGATTVDGLVSLPVVKRAVLLCSGESKIVLDWL